MRVEFISFQERSDRSQYIAGRFGDLLSGKLLDVGCDRAVLRDLLQGIEYTGIDVAGEPDLRLDLEQANELPFADASFDCVVCSDVLEHLDNLHQIFAELVRVARQTVVVSLPNNWNAARRPIERGRGAIGHYGLPAERPADRHKWFFSFSEAVNFIRAQAGKTPVSVREFVVNEKPRPRVLRFLRRLRYWTQTSYLNRYSHTLWAVLEKTG